MSLTWYEKKGVYFFEDKCGKYGMNKGGYALQINSTNDNQAAFTVAEIEEIITALDDWVIHMREGGHE